MSTSSSSAHPAAQAILQELERVAQERDRRESDPVMAERVHAVKRFQQARFRHTYTDVLSSPRFGPAARFFLDELYGPQDFTERDAQFARVVPTLVRLFPGEIVATVEALTQLHALSEELDGSMALAMEDLPHGTEVDAMGYAAAWRVVGRRSDRAMQVELVLAIGAELDRYTRMPMLSASLRMMRGPARMAGLASLQQFLESGFETFKSMRGADDFLRVIAQREGALIEALFDPAPLAPGRHPALVQLP